MSPITLGSRVCAGGKVQMVSCGKHHTMVLTELGCVWTCGDGYKGKLGHGDVTNHCTFVQVVLTGCNVLMPAMSMVAAGLDHSTALAMDGRIFTWGCAVAGKLGLYHTSNVLYNAQETRPMLVRSLQPHHVVMAASGNDHTVVLTREGIVLSWGVGSYGQLGLGDMENRHVPEQVDSDAVLGGGKFCMVACGKSRTALLTTQGVLYTCGRAISVVDDALVAGGDVVYANDEVCAFLCMFSHAVHRALLCIWATGRCSV